MARKEVFIIKSGPRRLFFSKSVPPTREVSHPWFTTSKLKTRRFRLKSIIKNCPLEAATDTNQWDALKATLPPSPERIFWKVKRKTNSQSNRISIWFSSFASYKTFSPVNEVKKSFYFIFFLLCASQELPLWNYCFFCSWICCIIFFPKYCLLKWFLCIEKPIFLFFFAEVFFK